MRTTTTTTTRRPQGVKAEMLSLKQRKPVPVYVRLSATAAREFVTSLNAAIRHAEASPTRRVGVKFFLFGRNKSLYVRNGATVHGR